MSAIKKSISLPAEMWSKAEARAAALGYPKMSQYLQQLVRRDLIEKGDHLRLAETATAHRISSPATDRAEAVADSLLPGDVADARVAASKCARAPRKHAAASKARAAKALPKTPKTGRP